MRTFGCGLIPSTKMGPAPLRRMRAVPLRGLFSSFTRDAKRPMFSSWTPSSAHASFHPVRPFFVYSRDGSNLRGGNVLAEERCCCCTACPSLPFLLIPSGMIRSSGSFRDVDCPFGPACVSSYCHFQHLPVAQLAVEISPPRSFPGCNRHPAAVAGCGYDPYNLEFIKSTVQSSNGTLGDIAKSDASILEMELVNKAIEVDKNVYELEQKKCEELLETSKASSLASTAAELVVLNAFPSREYTVGSYGAGGSADYNPTPLAPPSSSQPSKYTLDSFSGAKSKGSSLEYVPTMVTPPRKYGSPVTNTKYIIDNSRPSTDLEYDPLSNYSARLLSKVKEQKGAERKRTTDSEEGYSPSLKKHCDAASMYKLPARFSNLEESSKEEELEEKMMEDSLTTHQKRRISHITKQGNAEVPNKAIFRPYWLPMAQEVCYQRIQLAGQQLPPPPAQLSMAPQRASLAIHKGGKKWIAHMPNSAFSTLSKCAAGDLKKAVLSRNTMSTKSANTVPLKAHTVAGMTSKMMTTNVPKRIAHAPMLQSTTLKRPVIPTELGARVPINVRQRYLNLFIDECLKLCLSQQEALDKALSEEKVVYECSTSQSIYLNMAVNTLKKLRSLQTKTSNQKVVSQEAMLGGKLAAKTSFTLNHSPSLRVEDLTGAALFRRLKEYVLTEELLKEHGYPLPCPEKPGRAVVFAGEERKAIDGSRRVCCRCGTEYMVTATSNSVCKEECIYHWGRLHKQRVPGGWEMHYSCCSGVVASPGCQIAKQHVHDGRKENLEGFVKTFEKLPSADGYPGIYALDCEMCYTKQGLELTRITVIDSELKVVYDTFVKPSHKVVDYNTRFSGVTEADLENVSVTLQDVQAVLLCMFSADTILIGHSLESDLFALKLIHCTVVDTAVVFQHHVGLHYKQALRTLMADYLKCIIQDSVEGHDSSEDARACMELMIWKIKEDAKMKQ